MRPYLSTMRLTGFLAALLAVQTCQAAEALAGATDPVQVPAVPPARGRVWSPVPIGKFGDWQAATHQENGQTVCYALSYATSSQPLFQGRGHVVITVAMRPHNRDAVAILLGYSVLPHAGASMQAGGKRLHLYLEGRSAFAPHGQDAVAAFKAGKQAVGSFPGPRGLTLTDVFSLNGFAAAYAAIEKACPAS
jgi:invasion protein IalB